MGVILKNAYEESTPPELQFNSYWYKCVPGLSALRLDREPCPGESEVLQANQRFEFKKAVIERDTNNLTPDEVKKYAAEVAGAILTELKTWQKYDCFSRRPRKGATNVIDCRWVQVGPQMEVG